MNCSPEGVGSSFANDGRWTMVGDARFAWRCAETQAGKRAVMLTEYNGQFPILQCASLGAVFAMSIQNLRNIAIVAHVDHGKTTLVDQLLKQSGTFSDRAVIADRVMDRHENRKSVV